MVIWLLEDIGYKNIASSFHPFLSMTTENWSLLLGVWHAFPLSFPSTTAVNAWAYLSFSQPQPCFLPLVCSRVVSAVTGFEKEESWRQGKSPGELLFCHSHRHCVPRPFILFSSQCSQESFLSSNVLFFILQCPSPILAPDWYHGNDHRYLCYIQVTSNLGAAEMPLTSQIGTQHISL